MTIEYKKIQIDDRFSIERDSNGWTLITKERSINPKTKKPTVVNKQTFYGSLNHACTAIIDRAAGDCADVKQILKMLQRASSNLEHQASILLQ